MTKMEARKEVMRVTQEAMTEWKKVAAEAEVGEFEHMDCRRDFINRYVFREIPEEIRLLAI